jgi:cellulose synthase/poly-beta-1,6-N-acetylglucosamine synthase-like glycosyltransferase
VLIVSGTFGVFRKESVIAVGGYRRDTIGEDMELVCRLHCWHRMRQRPYRVTFVPDPICWTEAPESLSVLKSQRVRWQRGLGQSLLMNRALLFDRRGGAPGWIGFPVMAFFEWLGPAIEVAGYVVTIVAFAFGLISFSAFAAFMLLALGFGILLSLNALLLEVMTFQTYKQPRQLVRLLAAVMWENLGYRQLNAIWRVLGLIEWASGVRSVWGDMKRSGRWQREH